MKKIIFTLLLTLFTLIISSCDEETGPVFETQIPEEGIAFTNAFASDYLISEETEDNIADRFLWNMPDFGIPTNITYEIQGSIDPEFTTFDIIGSTNETNFAVLVSQLLDFAKDLGLDDDPTTTTEAGASNNIGQVYFRVRAFLGSDAAGSQEVMSDVQPISITWLEKALVGGACDSLYAVGGALTDIAWNFTPEGEVHCENDVLQVKVRFTNDKFRLFTEFGVWDNSYGYNYYTDEGYTIDPLLVDSNVYDSSDGDDNFWFDGAEGIYTMTIDKINKTITLKASGSLWAVGGAVPGGWDFNNDTVEFIESSPGIWSASITLSNDLFRFFQVFGVWDTNNNFAYYEDAGFTIDGGFENDGGGDANFNFVGTPGTYILTINEVDKVITLE